MIEGGKNKKGFYQARFRGTHLFSRKVFCKECGYSYIHYWCNQKKTIGAYKDSNIVKNHDPEKKCDNQNYGKIYEKDLEGITLATINGYIENYKDYIPLLLDALKSVIKKSPSEENKIASLKRRLKTMTSKRDKCMERYIEEDNKLMREDLYIRYQQFVKEIEELEQQLKAFSSEAKEQEIDFIEKRMKEIETVVAELQTLQELDRDIIESFIKRIEIAKDGNINVLLYGTGIKSFKVSSWNERQADKKPVSSFVYKGIEYRFNQEQYMGLIKENKYLSHIPLFSYVFPMSNNEISLKSNLPYMKNLV